MLELVVNLLEITGLYLIAVAGEIRHHLNKK